MTTTQPCDYCHAPFTPKRKGQRFCGDPQKACRQKWHQENANLPGTVKGLRQIKTGEWSVTTHYPTRPPVNIGTRVRLETTAEPRQDASTEANG